MSPVAGKSISEVLKDHKEKADMNPTLGKTLPGSCQKGMNVDN